MTRTPDDTKRGLECCATSYADCNKECPYMPDCDGTQFIKDALALIQQLEAQNTELLTKVEQLQAERDAAIDDIRLAFTSYVGACQTCKYCKNQVDCDEHEACWMCKIENCPCRTCGQEDRNWQWRGVTKEK